MNWSPSSPRLCIVKLFRYFFQASKFCTTLDRNSSGSGFFPTPFPYSQIQPGIGPIPTLTLCISYVTSKIVLRYLPPNVKLFFSRASKIRTLPRFGQSLAFRSKDCLPCCCTLSPCAIQRPLSLPPQLHFSGHNCRL